MNPFWAGHSVLIDGVDDACHLLIEIRGHMRHRLGLTRLDADCPDKALNFGRTSYKKNCSPGHSIITIQCIQSIAFIVINIP